MVGLYTVPVIYGCMGPIIQDQYASLSPIVEVFIQYGYSTGVTRRNPSVDGGLQASDGCHSLQVLDVQ